MNFIDLHPVVEMAHMGAGQKEGTAQRLHRPMFVLQFPFVSLK